MTYPTSPDGDSEARAMTDQPAAQPTPWEWVRVEDAGCVTEWTLEGPDVLCRFWHDKPPSDHALLLAAAPNTAAERDRLVKVNERLAGALALALSAFDNSLRSAGTSTAGFIATRKLMNKAEAAARAALAEARGQ